MNSEPNELREYIKSTLSSIEEGFKGTGFTITGTIDFDLAITNSTEGVGGFKIYVAKAEGKLKSEELSHLKFQAAVNSRQQSQMIRAQKNYSNDSPI